MKDSSCASQVSYWWNVVLMKCRFDRLPCTNFAPVRTFQSLPHLLTPSHTHMHQHTLTHMHTQQHTLHSEQIEATVKELCIDRNDAEVGVKRKRVAAGWGAWWKKLTHESHDGGKWFFRVHRRRGCAISREEIGGEDKSGRCSDDDAGETDFVYVA